MAVNVYIAFQTTGGAPSDTFKTWNDTTNNGTGTLFADLLDDSGAATGWGFECTSGTGSGNVGTNGVNSVGSGDAAWVDEAIISDHYHFTSTDGAAVYEISGLDNAKTYTIEHYASRDGSGTRITEISIDGFLNVADTVNALGNSSLIAVASNVSPSAGVITYSWRRQSGSSFGYINALRITENDAGGGSFQAAWAMNSNVVIQ